MQDFQIELVAISIGTPQEVEIKGQKVQTSIQKKAVKGPVYIHEKGVEGDKPALHTDAVYAISDEHYDYWAKELEVDRSTWNYGLFGENLTIRGIDEFQLRLGDILHIGNEVKLQVVSPRVPCSRLSWKLKQPDDFLRRFSLSGKTGYYLKVLQEGHVTPGDQVKHFQQDATAVSIADLSRFLVSVEEATEDQLYHILSHEHLGNTPQNMINRRIATINDLNLIKKGRWSGWRDFIVDQIVDEAEGIKSFWLKPKDDQIIAGYRPGQFLTCKIDENVIRTWTISDFDPTQNRYRLTIKKLLDGSVSSHMFDKVKEGSVLEIKPPNGSFILDRSTSKPVVLISAGIGITPMISMLKGHIQRDLKPYPNLYFVHAARNGRSHAFAKEIKEVISGVDRVKTLQYYSQPTDDDVINRDYDIKGHFKIEDLDKLMSDVMYYFGKKWQVLPKQDCNFYICGPTSFQDSVRKDLINWGVNDQKIFTESFKPLTGDPIGVKAEKSRVIFSLSGKEVEWTDKQDLTLLELAELCGIDAPNSCRSGVCETCECILKKGSVYYEHGHLANRTQQTVLTCCSKPGSDEVIIEL